MADKVNAQIVLELRRPVLRQSAQPEGRWPVTGLSHQHQDCHISLFNEQAHSKLTLDSGSGISAPRHGSSDSLA